MTVVVMQSDRTVTVVDDGYSAQVSVSMFMPPSLPPVGVAGGDLSGSYPNPLVNSIQGVVITGAAGAGKVLTASSAIAAAWATPSVSPATTVVTQTGYGQSSAVGSSALYARADHDHGTPALTTSAPTTSAVGDSSTLGTASLPALSDHKHGRESFGAVTAQTSFGASSGNGSAVTLARADHTHGTPALTLPVPIGSGGTGSATQNFVDLTTAQSIAGVKAFSSPPTGPTPVGSTDLTNKAYVDAVAVGLNPKPSATLATTTALPTNVYNNGSSGVGATLTGVATGVLTIDGTAVTLGMTVLPKNEAASANNGLYTCTVAGAVGVAYVLTRSVDMNTASEFPGAYSYVESGTANVGSLWAVSGAGPFTVGSTAVSYVQIGGASGVSAGTGLTLTGSVLSLTNPVTIALGGTGAATAQLGMNALAGSVTSGSFLRGNGTNVVMTALVSGDIPNNAANTSGSAASFTGNLVGDVTGTQGATVVGKIQGVAITSVEANLVSDLNNATTRSATATLLPGEETIFTGSTASQTLTLPASPPASSLNSITNTASVSVTVAPGAGTTLNNFGTSGNIVIPVGYNFSLVYIGTVWYVESAGPSDFAKGDPLAVANGGTGSTTQNFVDLTTAQAAIAGAKTFTGLLTGSARIRATSTGASSGTGGYMGQTGGGPPTSGTFVAGDFVLDGLYGVVWTCTTAGTPGTWASSGPLLLGSKILAASATNISINIPTYVNHIYGMWSGRQDSGSAGAYSFLRFNADSGAHYASQLLQGTGSTASSTNNGATQTSIVNGVVPGSGDTANYFGNGDFTISNIQSAVFKPVKCNFGALCSATVGYAGTTAGLWLSTAAMTSVALFPNSGNLTSGSSLDVWGWP